MQYFYKLTFNQFLCVAALLSGCTSHEQPHLKNECPIDSSTPFGNALLCEARRVSQNPNIQVLGSCQEIDELKAGKRQNLTSWRYSLTIEEAKTLAVEDLQLKPSVRR